MSWVEFALVIIVIYYALRSAWLYIRILAKKRKYIVPIPPVGKYSPIIVGNVITDFLSANKQWEKSSDTFVPLNINPWSLLGNFLYWMGKYKFVGVQVTTIKKVPFEQKTINKSFVPTGIKDLQIIKSEKLSLEEMPTTFFMPFIIDQIEVQSKSKTTDIFYLLLAEYQVENPLAFDVYLENNAGSMNNIADQYNAPLIQHAIGKTYKDIMDENKIDVLGEFQKSFRLVDVKKYGLKLTKVTVLDLGYDDPELIKKMQTEEQQEITNSTSLSAKKNEVLLKDEELLIAKKQKEMDLMKVAVEKQALTDLGEKAYLHNKKWTAVQNSKLTVLSETPPTVTIPSTPQTP